MSDQQIITYQAVVWMQKLKDAKDGKEYYMLGEVVGLDKTLAVTPTKGNGATMFFCKIHNIAYHPSKGFCMDCRLQVAE